MEFKKEKKKHLAYLVRIRPRALEIQNVLTFEIEHFADETRLEYMSFVEKNTLQHSRAALLAWWRYRKDTNTDKTIINSMKRSMELKKGRNTRC